VRGCNERERWYEHLPLKAGGSRGDLECRGAIGHGDAVADTDVLGDEPLELVDIAAVVREPARVEEIVHAGKKASPVAEMRATYVDGHVESGLPTEAGEIVHPRLHSAA
jgi:hypothetical protein